MPNCDGISATVYIRAVNPHVPIIAMTSNIRAEDIATYYQWGECSIQNHTKKKKRETNHAAGMNDILAKPFTKDGMVRILKRHCRHLLRDPKAADMELNGTALSAPAGSGATPSYSGMQAGGVANPGTGVKFEAGTPIQSPATTGSWHSPSQQMAHASPNLDAGGYMTAAGGVSGPQLVMNPSGMPRGAFAPQMGTPPIPRMSDHLGGDDRPEKRQRLYGPAGGYMQP